MPLQATADVRSLEGSAQLYREDLKQMLPITGRLEGRDLGSVMKDVKTVLDAERLPVGYTYQIGGQYETQQRSFRSLLVVAALALLLVFGLLVGQFRRFTAALVIVSAAPLSLVGAFGLLLATHTPLNVSSFMGLILLIGLIVKNGIILVDHANALFERGVEWPNALVQAGAVRLQADPDDDALHAVRTAAAGAGARAGGGDAATAGDRRHWRVDGVHHRDAAVRPDGAVADQRWNSDVSARIGGREAPGLSSVWTE